MRYPIPRRFLITLFSALLSLLSWTIAAPAHAYDNPELLPDYHTPVIDLANALNSAQEDQLASELAKFETDTGWKLRVLTQIDRTPGLAVRDYWNLDSHSILLVADPRGGNLLNFNVGLDVYPYLPRTFWVELQTRYGNQYFVRDQGEDQSILASLNSIKTCLAQGGCRVVPGLPQEQWILTLVTSVAGGIVFGFAGHSRKGGKAFSWQWALIFSPLWGILFVAFGIGPVVSRTSEWLPLLRNVIGFSAGALVAYLTPIMNTPSASEGI